ncbi:hypothetical protein E3C22_18245 [Jiella endophytica]|uniref:Uncharacterized protein n=1 Tax=Jiella endophytica TaxID=2558362 RepID=A0A4Y8RFQ5_9HYPH|nr:hypothetical protein [Jiella endophytica]TFF20829.1 hypothetical protein E3C22_18245 [Jiella endophytica]
MEDFFSEKYNILLKEWQMASDNIGRFDTLIFIIRGWSVVTASAVVAYAYQGNDSYPCLLAIVPIIFLWYMDALFKSFQRTFVQRSRKIENYLASEQFQFDFEQRTAPRFRIPELATSFGKGTFWNRIADVLKSAFIRNVVMTYAFLIILLLVSFALIPNASSAHKESAPSTVEFSG